MQLNSLSKSSDKVLVLSNLKLKPRIENLLEKTLTSEAFGSPFIIEGPDRVFTYDVAVAFAHEILLKYSSETTPVKLEKCSHPDFLTFRPEGARSMHSISEIKRLVDDSIMPPFEGKYKVYLIKDCEAMLPVHANALLKTLEEKPHHTIILLTATTTSHLLPTIVSRCKVLSLDEAATQRKIDVEFEQNVIDLLAHAQARYITKAFSKIPKIEKVIDDGGVAKLEEFIDIVSAFYRDLSLIDNIDDIDLLLPKYKTIYSQLANTPKPTFHQIMELVNNIHLGYQRHIKIKTLIEAVIITPARLS